LNCPTCNSELLEGQQTCVRCGTNVAHLTTNGPRATTAPTPGLPPPPPAGSPFAPPSNSFNIVEQTVPLQTSGEWGGPAWQVGDAGNQPTTAHQAASHQAGAFQTGPYQASPYQPTVAQPTTQYQPGGYQPAGVPAAGSQPAWTGLGIQPGAILQPVSTTGSVALAVIASLAGLAAIIGSFLPMLTMTTDAPIGADQTGDFTPNDLVGGTNLQVAFIVAGITLIAGGAVAKLGKRFGAGLACGAGLALIPFVVWLWGATKVVSDAVEGQATIVASSGGGGTFFQSKLGAGFYILVGAAVVGLLALFVSLAQTGLDNLKPLNRLVCAGGAIAALLAAIGQLLPENGAEISANWETGGGSATLVYSRLGILFVVAIAGAAGFLYSSRWGVGLALGASAMYAWQWISSILEAGDFPAPPAFGNPGAFDAKPHVLTTAGVIAMLVFAGLAFITGRSDVEVS
jgi:hypothetical protein